MKIETKRWTELGEYLLGLHASDIISIVFNADRVGSTGYIDSFRPDDFPPGYRTMKGTDPGGRKFLTFLVDVGYEKAGCEIGKRAALTLFQRYSDPKEKNFWVPAGHLHQVLHRDDQRIIDIIKIKSLLQGDKIYKKWPGLPTHWAEPVKASTTSQNRE